MFLKRPHRLLKLLALAFTGLLFACSPSPPETEINESPLSSTNETTISTINEKSIAVLPFTDLSEEGDQEYFSDGLTEELIERLSMMDELEVASRDSSFYYKNRNEVLNSIGENLQVAYIMQGSVRRSANQLRVSAQLVNAKDGFNVWSRSFDREVADIFAIQDEIAEAVKTALSVSLGAGEFKLPGNTRNVEAYDLTLQAVAMYSQFAPDAVFRAINLAEEAVRIDPNYGRAWLLLGVMYSDSQMILSADQSAGFQELTTRSFENAQAVAPDMPELVLVDAGAQRNNGEFLAAEQLYQQYFERYGMDSARANDEYAQLLARVGRVNEAIEYQRRAKSLEPFTPQYTFRLALSLLSLGRVEEALAEAEYGKTIEGGQWLFSSLFWIAAASEGDFESASLLIHEYYANEDEIGSATVSGRFMEKIAAILVSNDFEASLQEISDLIESPSVTPYEMNNIARLVAWLDEPDIAINFWMGQPIMPNIWDTYFSDMRQLPEFTDLVEEAGLLEYWQAKGEWGDYCQPLEGVGVVCE